jgi:mandelate racemase
MDFGSAALAQPYQIVDGQVTAQGPGLGMEWNEDAVKRYALN